MNSSLFKRKDFLSYIAGNALSQIGSDVTQFVISLYVLEKTGSATIFASLLSIIIVPRMLLSPLSGVLADRLDRKKLLILFNLLNGMVLFSLGLLHALTGDIALWVFYLLVLYLEVIELFYGPASSAVFPSILKEDELTGANSLHSMISTVSQIIGPIVAGFLYRSDRVGLILFCASGLYFLAMLTKLPLRLPVLEGEGKGFRWKGISSDLKEAVDFLRKERILLQIMLCSGIINLFFSPLFAISWTFVAREVLHISSKSYGVGQGVALTGMIFGSLLMMGPLRNVSSSRLLWMVMGIVSGIVMLLALNLFWVWQRWQMAYLSYILGVFLTFCMAMVVVCINIAMGTFLQRFIPLSIMGRMMTLMMMINTGTTPLGYLLYGYLLDHFPLLTGFVLTSVILFLTTLYLRAREKEIEHFMTSQSKERREN